MRKSNKALVILLIVFLQFSSNERCPANTDISGTNKNEAAKPLFPDQLLGDYISGKETIVIGKSKKKLFAYFEKAGLYRELNSINDTVWVGGNTVIDTAAILKFVFKRERLEVSINDKLTINAKKTIGYRTENIVFSNSDHIRLGGTVFKPLISNGKAIVLVHGSGNQDRHGNNSCIRILADVLARQGVTVLTYDKQGVGSSEGNWEIMNFTALSGDALSGIKYLKGRTDLNLSKIGLGGYSQAGWVMARAIEQGGDIDFVLAINAAGSGITVAEQNIYDVKTQMQCENKFSRLQKKQITSQQKYFFGYLSGHKNGEKLDAITLILKNDSLVKEWLYPSTLEIDFKDRKQWYNALEVGFNPLPIWKNFHKPTLMTVAEFDDSTPAKVVQSNVKKLHNKNITIKFLKGCQHLGLETNSVCDAKINSLKKLSPAFFSEIINWMAHI
jgi:pimeloyl-ACP methyl ester carboxylesterase